jgi:hypothetical protein
MVKIIYTTLFVTCLLFSSSVVAQYCSGTVVKTTATGTFSDGSGSNNYNNNTDCSWRISPPGAGTITLSFTGVFDLELYNCSDKITVYDGADTTANVLDVLCGNSNLTPPAPITSTGGQMFVRFTSDVSYNNAGWNASYTTTIAPPVYCSGQSTLNAASGNLSDGSLSSNYGDNANCSWLIEPTGANSITLTFSTFDTEAGMDFVKVYDNSTSTLVSTFSGNAIPSPITVNSGSMLVEFTSNNTTGGPGWDASYTSTQPPPVYCSGANTLTAPAGSFDDGSGTADYSNDADCSWTINPSNVTSITLTFSEFSTQGGQDFVKVYNNSTSALLGSFSGSSIPAPITLNGDNMLVEFTSNSTTTSLGWSASYSSVDATAGIHENSLVTSLKVFPNPFHTTATLLFSAPETEESLMTITDIYGKAVKKTTIPANTTSLVIDANSLANGMYFYTVSKKNTLTHKGKLIIE